MMWLLLVWCLLSVPLGVVVGRCIAAADATDGGDDDPWPPATPPAPPVLVLAGRR